MIERQRLPVQIEIIPHRLTPEHELEVLALHRVPERGGFWQPVTGGLESTDPNEEAAAFRELQEELGIGRHQVVDLRPLGFEFTFIDDKGVELTERVYHAEFKPDAEVVVSDEHDNMKWGTYEEVRELYRFEETKQGLDLLIGFLVREGRISPRDRCL